MARNLILEFTKMQGAGNDFVVVDNRFYNFTDEELSRLASHLCPRRTGIGADGLLAFARPESSSHDYRMRYFNADGSRATMCGNGARCLARFAQQAGLEKEELVFESDAGVYRAHVPSEAEAPVCLFTRAPRDFTPEKPLKDGAADGMETVPYIWTGTHHVVVFSEDIDAAPVERLGRIIRKDEAFAPEGTNVNFVEVEQREPAVLRVRTFEKGVEAETQACGTGALAAAVVARLLGHTYGSTATVQMPGGRLTVGFQADGDTVSELYLEGPADVTFRGTIELEKSLWKSG